MNVNKALKLLSAKQQAFVVEWLVDYNGTQAAIRAGYSPGTAVVKASQLLANPKIKPIIEHLKKKDLEQANLSKESILARVSNNLHRNLCDLVDDRGNCVSDLRKIPERAHAWIDGLEVRQDFDDEGNVVGQTIKYKLAGNTPIQEIAMKHRGLFAAEKQEVQVQLDWDKLCQPTVIDVDPIEEQIKAIESPKKQLK